MKIIKIKPSLTPGFLADGSEDDLPKECLSCGAAVLAAYCPQCGQSAQVHRTLTAFLHDLLHGVIHFEGKLWRTLPMLAWQPGKLTREYIDGRRSRYISPVALFLLAIFLTFALFSALGGVHSDGRMHHDPRRSLSDARVEFSKRIAAVELQRKSQEAGRPSDLSLDKKIVQLRNNQDLLDRVSIPDEGSVVNATGLVGTALSNALESTWHEARENPALFLYELQTSAYKYGWLLILISVPFLWVLFPFSRTLRLYDHTVFVAYSISFMLMLTIIFSLVIFVDVAALGIAPLAYAPIHMFRQFKGAYDLSVWSAFWRSVAALFFAVVALLLFAVVLLAMVPT